MSRSEALYLQYKPLSKIDHKFEEQAEKNFVPMLCTLCFDTSDVMMSSKQLTNSYSLIVTALSATWRGEN